MDVTAKVLANGFGDDLTDPYRGLKARRPASKSDLAWRDALIDKLAKQYGKSRAEILASFNDVGQRVHLNLYAPQKSSEDGN